MRDIQYKDIVMMVKQLCIDATAHLPKDVYQAMQEKYNEEDGTLAKKTLKVLLDNATLASHNHMPICQDTGMAFVYITMGQDIHISGGSLNEAIQEGVRQGYQDGYLRKSVVDDPLFDRINTKDNTPAIIYYEIVEGDIFHITLAPKGFGSENMSQIKMLKPSDGVDGVKDFVMKVVNDAGPNACPPMVIGVGIGGSFDKVTMLAKKAMMREIGSHHVDPRYAALETELLEMINSTG
ncbi:MAG: fumarate hydratase, partial [Faecalibacillus sp.]